MSVLLNGGSPRIRVNWNGEGRIWEWSPLPAKLIFRLAEPASFLAEVSGIEVVECCCCEIGLADFSAALGGETGLDRDVKKAERFARMSAAVEAAFDSRRALFKGRCSFIAACFEILRSRRPWTQCDV